MEYFYRLNGFDTLGHELLKHLSLLRIVEPVSKIKSVELLGKYFGIHYTKNQLYKSLPSIAKLQNQVEARAVEYATQHLGFDFTLVFYDMTTIYFESSQPDDLRMTGFSKEG